MSMDYNEYNNLDFFDAPYDESEKWSRLLEVIPFRGILHFFNLLIKSEPIPPLRIE